MTTCEASPETMAALSSARDDAGRVEQHPWAAGVETETYHEKGISESEHETESEMKNVLTIGVSMRIILGIILFAMGIAIACSTFMKYTEYPFCSCARFLAGGALGGAVAGLSFPLIFYGTMLDYFLYPLIMAVLIGAAYAVMAFVK